MIACVCLSALCLPATPGLGSRCIETERPRVHTLRHMLTSVHGAAQGVCGKWEGSGLGGSVAGAPTRRFAGCSPVGIHTAVLQRLCQVWQ